MHRTAPAAPETTRSARRSARVLSLALVAAGLGACSEGPLPPPAAGASRVSMTYQGPVSGSYSAEGEVQMGRGMLDHTYAYGLRYQGPSALEIRSVAYDAGSNVVDWVDVEIPAAAEGTYGIDRDRCAPSPDLECAGVTVVLDLVSENGQQARYGCMLTSGSIRVTEVSGSRAAGTFSGTGECVDRDATDGAPSPAIAVTGGEFDVALIGGSRG